MSRQTLAEQEGRNHRRKERRTEGGGRSRSGAAGPGLRGGAKAGPAPQATPLCGPDRSPGPAEAGRPRSTGCPGRCAGRERCPSLSPRDACYLGSELGLCSARPSRDGTAPGLESSGAFPRAPCNLEKAKRLVCGDDFPGHTVAYGGGGGGGHSFFSLGCKCTFPSGARAASVFLLGEKCDFGAPSPLP